MKRVQSYGLGIHDRPSVVPDRPTDFLPGTEGKIRVMMQRARLGQGLFHPEDATGCQIIDALLTILSGKKGAKKNGSADPVQKLRASKARCNGDRPGSGYRPKRGKWEETSLKGG